MPLPRSIALGFDFYGAGNIGDDLMVAGFLRALDQLRPEGERPQLTGVCAGDIESQRGRFPEIRWLDGEQGARTDAFDPSRLECWAGVGGTPLQITAGDWFLRYLERHAPEVARTRRRVLIGIGAEAEIAARAEDFARVLEGFHRVTARDEHSAELILRLAKVPEERVFVGSDLANIVLPELYPRTPDADRAYRLGLIIAGERLGAEDVKELGRFLAGRRQRVALLANEARPQRNYELGIYRRLGRFPLSAARRKSRVFQPPYSEGTLADLVRPYASCGTVISSRYHGILIAAWAGCRVAALGRSSKITALATELDLPCQPFPLDRRGLTRLEEQAVVVPRERLEALTRRAVEGVAFAFDGIDASASAARRGGRRAEQPR